MTDAPIESESDQGAAAELAPIFKGAWESANRDGFEGRRTLLALRYLLDQQLISRIEPYPTLEDVERLCEAFHDAYEKAAPSAGWATQEASRKPWSEVPEANKETMRATVTELLDTRAIVLPR